MPKDKGHEIRLLKTNNQTNKNKQTKKNNREEASLPCRHCFCKRKNCTHKKKLEQNWTGGIEDFGIFFENGKTAKKKKKNYNKIGQEE